MSSRDTVSPEAIRAQLGDVYDRFAPKEQLLHAKLLQSIVRPEDIAVEVEGSSGERSVVTVCTSDRVGALSIIAGLFTVYGLDIARADLFTLHFPSPRGSKPFRSPRRRERHGFSLTSQPTTKILDIFEVRVPEAAAELELWRRFRKDLSSRVGRLVAEGPDIVRDEVIDGFSAGIRRPRDGDGQLLPIKIEVSNEVSSIYTQLSVRSTDTVGFLFALANALTMARVNIERAEIRTVGGEARDTFWLTDYRGRKITDRHRIDELRFATALIKHFTYLLPRSANPAQALHQFHALTQQVLSRANWTSELLDLESPAVLETLTDLLGRSQFLWEDFLRMQHENLFPVLVEAPLLEEQRSKKQLQEAVDEGLFKSPKYEDQVLELNRFKDREMFRIDLRHITHRIGFRSFSEELTDLAEIVVEKAADLSKTKLSGWLPATVLENGESSSFCICALGKFGGRELGYGSDIELVLVYDEEGKRTAEASRFFRELVSELTETIVARQKGIFEIDMRLRPHGTAGALATSLGGFRQYYTEAGPARQFERLALVKLRPVTGSATLGRRVVEARDAFVYSGTPVDLGNIQHLRRRQASELVPAGAVSAKYSPGGLVDLEYFVQAMQIEAGHMDPAVRVTGTVEALDRLAEGGHVPTDQAREISEAYQFQRRLIDALRVVRGHAKDLTVPTAESRESGYLAKGLGFQSSAELHAAIAERMGMASGMWKRGMPSAT